MIMDIRMRMSLRNLFAFLLAMIVLLLLAACATQPPDIKSADVKNGTVVCATVMGPWGSGKTVVANLDSGVIRNGGVTVDPNCVITITTQSNPPKEPAK